MLKTLINYLEHLIQRVGGFCKIERDLIKFSASIECIQIIFVFILIFTPNCWEKGVKMFSMSEKRFLCKSLERFFLSLFIEI